MLVDIKRKHTDEVMHVVEAPEFDKPTRNAINLSGVNLRTKHLRGADLRKFDLTRADMYDADLRDALLPYVWLTAAHLSFAKFAGAMADHAKFWRSYCTGVDFRDARLRGADFRLADLMGSKFDGADLTGAQISGALMWGVELAGATVAKDYVVSSDNQYHFIVNLAPEYRDGHWGQTLELYKCNTGWFVRRGNIEGSPDEVLAGVAKSVDDAAFTEKLKSVLELFCA